MKQLSASELSEVRTLVDNIRKWKKAYYDGNPLVTDQAYDGAEMRLAQLIPNHPVLSEVGAPSDGFEQIDYVSQGEAPMLSLDKVHSVEEVIKFIDGRDYVPMVKLDGLSVCAIYENGKLSLAHTRGNSKVGEKITNNFYFVHGAIPENIGEFKKFSVRGEVCMSNADFESLNKEQAAKGAELFSNPRNAATGSLKQKTWIETAYRKVVFLAYCLHINGQPEMSKRDQLLTLEKMGFKTPRIKIPAALKGIKECIEETTNARPNLPIQIDGIVFALNNVCDRIGYTNHHPKFETAYKFASESGITKLLDIEWNVSRTRRVVPVGKVSPIEIGGAVINKLTLNNAKWLFDNRIIIGEEIEMERANDVIPKFKGMCKDLKDLDQSKVVIPRVCPSCSSKLVVSGVDLLCPNVGCPGAAVERIKHYVSKPVVNIEGVGTKLIDQLVEANLIKTPADLFKLTKEQLMPIDRMGERKADNVLTSIDKAKKQSPEVFLLGLGVEALGKDISAKIADFVNFDTLEITCDIMSIDGVAEKTAKSVTEGLKEIKWLADELRKYVTIEKKQIVKVSDSLGGKSYCVSGHVELDFKDGAHYEDREAIQALIKNYGGRVVTSVSKKLDILVAGPGSGSKSDKAKEYGIPIITGADLVKMMEGSNTHD